MATYDIPKYPTKRLRYFKNQFLNDQDFITDQAYQIAREQAHLRALCVAGICEGLDLRYVPATKRLELTQGVAVDSQGRLIVVDPVGKGPTPETLADGRYIVHIAFREEPADLAPPAGQGTQDNTRWLQTPRIGATAQGTPPPGGAVVLGSFSVAAAEIVATSVSPEGRQYSGLRLPGAAATSASLTSCGAGDAAGAVLSGSLTIRRKSSPGQLGPVLTLLNDGAFPGGAGTGAAIDFDAYDSGESDPSLRLQSKGDNKGSSHLVLFTKLAGPVGNKLVERLRFTSEGSVRFAPDSDKDKLVLSETGPKNRYGIGVNGDNIYLFCPEGGHLSLRQDDRTGTEVFKVTGAGAGTFLGNLSIEGSLKAAVASWGENDSRTEVRNDAGLRGDAGARSGFFQTSAPLNFPPGASGSWHLLDVRSSDPTSNFAMQFAGAFEDQSLWFRKTGNNAAAPWQKVVLADADGNADIQSSIKFPNRAPNNRILFWDEGPEVRYGLGINPADNNLNLFCPPYAHFSLRQNGGGGKEVFTVGGKGTVTVTGNREVLQLLGDDHCYIGFYPRELRAPTHPSGAFVGWFGYGRPGNDALEVGNQAGGIELYAKGAVRVMKLGDFTGNLAVEGAGKAQGGFSTGHFDLAETFADAEDQLEPGDVVSADPRRPERLVRSREPQQANLLGVISEKPGFLLGVSWEGPAVGKPLALAGRVPVKVNLEGGPIRIGDWLTSSAQPGHAKRCTTPGRVIGMALQAFDGSVKDTGKVVVFVNPHWWGRSNGQAEPATTD